MRILEGLLFLGMLFIIMLFFKGNPSRIKLTKYASISLFIIFSLHLIIESSRWQLYPLYFTIMLFSVMYTLCRLGASTLDKIYSNKRLRAILSVPAIILIILSLASCYAFPLYKIMKPTGEYKIGTISFDAEDDNRPVSYTNGLCKNRKIRIQVWYPAGTVKGYPLVPWLHDGPIVAETIGSMMGFPAFILRHTALIKSNSHRSAPISNRELNYPLVIISHGLTGFRNLHTDTAELLASNGYVVASINHTYNAAITVFDSGEIAYLNRDALPFGGEKEEFLYHANKILNCYSEDIEFAISVLEKLNLGEVSSILKGKLNLTKIGLLGHSAGGGAGIITSIKNERITCILGFDPWVEPIKDKDVRIGLKVPSLFLRSEQWEVDSNNENLYSLISNSKEYTELYQIDGTTHLDYTMIYMFSPLTKYYGFTGTLDGWRGAAIRNDFVLNFFNKFMLPDDTNTSIKNIADKYSEVIKIKGST